jgi:hypothetical protein
VLILLCGTKYAEYTEKKKKETPMYKTMEAVYEKGALHNVNGTLPKTKTRVLITVLGPVKEAEQPIRLSRLWREKGLLKNLKENPVTIQRRMRDAW